MLITHRKLQFFDSQRYNNIKKKYKVRKIEKFVTEIINGYKILVDFVLDVILEHREGSEYSGGRHVG